MKHLLKNGRFQIYDPKLNFDMDLIIVIVNLEFLNNSEGFIPYKRLPEKFHNKKHNLEHFGISAQFSLRFRD